MVHHWLSTTDYIMATMNINGYEGKKLNEFNILQNGRFHHNGLMPIRSWVISKPIDITNEFITVN